MSWLPFLSVFSLYSDPVKAELFLKRKVVICKGWQDFFSKTLRIWLATHLRGHQGLQTHPVCRTVSHHGRPGSCMAQVSRGSLHSSLDWWEPSLVLSHSKQRTFSDHSVNEVQRNTSQEEYATSKMQREPLGAIPQFWLLEGPRNNLSFVLSCEVFWHAHTTWALEGFTMVVKLPCIC